MSKFSTTVIGVTSALLLVNSTGCSTIFSPNEGVPIVHRAEVPGEGTNISAVTAGRRMVFTKNMKSDNVTCSEPPPDVAQAYSAALALSGERDKNLKLNLLKGDDKSDMSSDDKVRAAFDYGQATAQSELGPKSQALLLFRQGAFTLCQAYSNRAINGDEQRAVAKSLAEEGDPKKANLERSQEKSAEFATKNRISESKTRELFSSYSLFVDKGLSFSEAAAAAVSGVIPDKISATQYSVSFGELLKEVKAVMIEEIKYMYLHQPGSVTVNAPSVQIAAGTATVPGDTTKPVDPTKPGGEK